MRGIAVVTITAVLAGCASQRNEPVKKGASQPTEPVRLHISTQQQTAQPDQPLVDPKAQLAERVRQANQKYTGAFPDIAVGMKRLDLETKLVDMNPEFTGLNGKPARNVWISHEAQFQSIVTVTYTVNKGRDQNGLPRRDLVMVTYRDNVVIGFSR